ncbi:hypothetical protein B0G74_2173 [Paraburkholderia sp. BL9I2N2]|nr:hypothetical protein B0G74_2173 [Paraburkholderia sp. BL9I2N2]
MVTFPGWGILTKSGVFASYFLPFGLDLRPFLTLRGALLRGAMNSRILLEFA